jgi:hypothetical protein
MKKIWMAASLAGAAIALSACGTAEKMAQDKGYEPVSQAQLEEAYSRTRTIAWRNSAGRGGTATYHADGTAQVTWDGGEDEGHWRIADGRFCSKWTTVRNGIEHCTRSYKVGDNEYQVYNPDGTLNSTVSFVD